MNFSNILISRVVRALRLDPTLYLEVEEDVGATAQAIVILLITGACTGIGLAITGVDKNISGISVFFMGIAASTLGWICLLFIIYILGSTLFVSKRKELDFSVLFRSVSFSASPGVLRFFIFIPGVGLFLDFAAQLWCIAGMIVALRQLFDFSTGRATGLCIAGWIIYSVLIFGLLKSLGVEIVLPVK